MFWILHKLAEYMNRPYDFTDELERLREKHRLAEDLREIREKGVDSMGPRGE